MPPRAARLEGLETTIFTEMTALAQRTGAINLGQGFPDTDGPTEAIDAATNTAGPPITVGSQPFGIAVTPDGKAVYVANFSSGSVTPISTATNTAGTPIVIGATAAIDIAITPDGKAAYVTNDTSESVTPIKIATNTAGTPIAIGTEAGHIAITPDGKTAYVSSFLSSGVVTPINLATNTVGTAISVGSFPLGVAITLDQAPTATFSVVGAPAGEASRFDGSGSSSPVGTVASYRWDFGDGQSATTTTPQTKHVYAHPGSYTVRLTVTNSAGTSTTQVFTGQTVSNQGGPQATTTRTVAVATPTVSALKVSPTTFSLAGRKVNGKCVKATAKNSGKPRCSRQIELKVGYTLNAADTVTLTLRRQSPGRKVKGRCVKPTEANKKHKPCTRLIALNGQISLTGATGANGFRFNGKIGGHTLGPGTYRLIAAPADGAPRAVRFKIAG